MTEKTSEKLKVLVCPLNWGLGHATRDVPIINRLLDLGHEVIQFKMDHQMDIEHTCKTMMDYLVNYFENHILKYDKEAIVNLREKGF